MKYSGSNLIFQENAKRIFSLLDGGSSNINKINIYHNKCVLCGKNRFNIHFLPFRISMNRLLHIVASIDKNMNGNYSLCEPMNACIHCENCPFDSTIFHCKLIAYTNPCERKLKHFHSILLLLMLCA